MPDLFSATYAEAREKFLSLAREKKALIHSVFHPELGVEGEELAMDLAVFGDPRAEKTLLIISGTHGQEGFLGSAAQLDYLRDLTLPDGVNLVALHALNPWGFSHLSRTDELNVDVNRNFLDFSKPLPSQPLYAELHPLICPEDWADFLPAAKLVPDLMSKYDTKDLLDATTGGQFETPTGLNFGGRAPTWSNRMVSDHLPPLLASARKLAFIEWHTGLGEFGELCYICKHEPGSSDYDRIWTWMGEEARGTFAASFDADGKTPTHQGLFSAWIANAAPRAECTGLIVEVGTYDTARVWDAVRMDRLLKFGRGMTPASREHIRRDMLEGLYPESEEWRERALVGAHYVHARMLDGLGTW